MNIFVFFLTSVIAFGAAGVTSQEQFKRLGESGSSYSLKYNFDRAYLEAPAGTNCPSGSKAFYKVHISKEGVVERVKGHLVGLSADLKSVALKWADGLLKQMRFKPLMYGAEPSSVDMALTLVCAE